MKKKNKFLKAYILKIIKMKKYKIINLNLSKQIFLILKKTIQKSKHQYEDVVKNCVKFNQIKIHILVVQTVNKIYVNNT